MIEIDFDMEINELLVKLGELRSARQQVIDDHLFSSDVKEWLVDNLSKEIGGIERDITLIVEAQIE